MTTLLQLGVVKESKNVILYEVFETIWTRVCTCQMVTRLRLWKELEIIGDNTKHAIWTVMLSLLALITTFKRKSVMGQSYYLSVAVGRIITIISSRVVTPNKIVCLTHWTTCCHLCLVRLYRYYSIFLARVFYIVLGFSCLSARKILAPTTGWFTFLGSSWCRNLPSSM